MKQVKGRLLLLWRLNYILCNPHTNTLPDLHGNSSPQFPRSKADVASSSSLAWNFSSKIAEHHWACSRLRLSNIWIMSLRHKIKCCCQAFAASWTLTADNIPESQAFSAPSARWCFSFFFSFDLTCERDIFLHRVLSAAQVSTPCYQNAALL